MLPVAYVFFGLFIVYEEVACEGDKNRIINGLVADRDNFPYQVSLQINHNLHCGGAILDEWHVLTAAHCVEGYYVGNLSIVVGSADLRSTVIGARHRISAMKVHENYKSGNGWANDIALLRLTDRLIFNTFVRPALLPQRGEDWEAGQSAVISGFGQTNQNSPLSPILYKTQVFIVSNVECQQPYYYTDLIRPTNICARHPNKTTGFCRGDSGGPLNVNRKVIGLVSFSLGYGCADAAKIPQVYTRLSSYIDWINHWRNQQS